MKVVLDTNVIIGFFRNPAQREEFELRAQRPLLFMSAVVALELFAGCRTSRQEKSLKDFLKPFEKAGRIITPDYEAYQEAGRVIAAISREGIGAAHCRQIVNDTLIAVTAAKFGAVLVTANVKDFSMIAKHTPVRWMQPD